MNSNNNQPNMMNNLSSANSMGEIYQTMASIVNLLSNLSSGLVTLRREFRGEMLYQDEDGNSHWIQASKPVFVKIDPSTEKPRIEKRKMPDGSIRNVYLPNDEAIDEILSMLKFAGINNVSPIGYNQPDNYLDDLKEFECKLASVLALKQKEWGLDKELLPMLQFKIKTIVQDTRSLSVKGNTIKAIQTTVQRVEQSIEGERINNKRKSLNPLV